jgi:hypothetical protein
MQQTGAVVSRQKSSQGVDHLTRVDFASIRKDGFTPLWRKDRATDMLAHDAWGISTTIEQVAQLVFQQRPLFFDHQHGR